MIHASSKTSHLWATPTVSINMEGAAELNGRLAQIVLQEERRLSLSGSATPVAGLESGLTTHWMEYNVLDWNYPEIAEFRRHVLCGIREFIRLAGDPDDPKFAIVGISCWANVLRHGEALQVHHHDPAYVSAHYTVQTGQDASQTDARGDSGHTVYFRPGFIDRSHGGSAAMAPSPWDDDWRISNSPQAGRLFLFPSYVRHEVRPNLGPAERISIAMDVFLKSQELPIYYGKPRFFVPGAAAVQSFRK